MMLYKYIHSLLINCKDVAFILRINEIDVTKLLRCFCVPKLIVIFVSLLCMSDEKD
jgi:hypothetical protein